MLTRWSDYAALPIRLVLGALFMILGSQKLFGYFGGPGLTPAVQFLESTGLTPGVAWAWVPGLVELLGGAALVLGALTRWAAFALAAASIVAIFAAAAGALVNVQLRVAALAALSRSCSVARRSTGSTSACPNWRRGPGSSRRTARKTA